MCERLPEAGRLYVQGGLKGCLSDNTNPPRFTKVSEVQVERQNLPVHSPSFRAICSTKVLHESAKASTSEVESSRCQNGCLPGRLSCDSEQQAKCRVPLSESSRSSDSSRIHYKSRKISTDGITTDRVSGVCHRFSGNDICAPPGQSEEDCEHLQKLPEQESGDLEGSSTSDWSPNSIDKGKGGIGKRGHVRHRFKYGGGVPSLFPSQNTRETATKIFEPPSWVGKA